MIVFAQFMFEYSNTAKIPYAIMYKNCLFKLHKFDILTDKLLNDYGNGRFPHRMRRRVKRRR